MIPRPRMDCPTGPAQAGSRLQLQRYVNEAPALLNAALAQAIPALPDDPRITWVSPLARANYAEYRDDAFLAALHLHHLAPQLVGNFWPRGGPCWDALAIVRSATDPTDRAILLAEAKSHLQEVYGTGCQAGPHSLPRILEALTETATAAGTVVTPAWTGRLYQTANRLAHLHFFREMVRMPAWLVDVSFVHDPYKPTTRGQWEAFLPTVWRELRIDPDRIAGRCGLFLDPLLRGQREVISGRQQMKVSSNRGLNLNDHWTVATEHPRLFPIKHFKGWSAMKEITRYK